ncbi:hypothetical protein ACIBTP_34530 [Streptomyces avidinii]|uniref:hypothetical protein n=1 Tax=Streptomyces avidinii TaxID=1895 RepID=UPI00379E4ECD
MLPPTPDFAEEAADRAAVLAIPVTPAPADLVRNTFVELDRTRRLPFTYGGGHGVKERPPRSRRPPSQRWRRLLARVVPRIE